MYGAFSNSPTMHGRDTGMRNLGHYLWFGLPMPLRERLAAIRAAGFDAVSLWWDVRRGMGRERLLSLPDQARAAGLAVDNAHLLFARCNLLWSPQSAERDAAQARYLGWLDECAGCDVRRVVLHLTSGDAPPPPSPEGIAALARLVEEAAAREMMILLENVRSFAHLDRAFAEIPSPHLGFCFDSSHARLWGPDELLRRYGARLGAVHFADNDGSADRHWLPGAGVIDWPTVLADFPRESYRYPITLEVVAPDASEAPTAFLARAYQQANWIAGMIGD